MTGVHPPHPMHECQKKGVAEFAICKSMKRTRMRGASGGGCGPEWEECPPHPRCFRSSGQEKMEDIKKFSRCFQESQETADAWQDGNCFPGDRAAVHRAGRNPAQGRPAGLGSN